MANAKISALTSATTPLAGTEVLPIVQSSTTKQVSVANLTTGREIAAKSVTVSGNSAYGQGKIFATSAEGLLLQSITGSFFDAGLLNAAGNAYAWTVATGTNDFKMWNNATIGNGSTNTHVLNGNMTVNSAAKGFNFTANTGAAGKTSQLLNWYEEGTWTPTVTASTGTITAVATSGTYTRIGRQVTIFARIEINNNGTGAGTLRVTGMPFAAANAKMFNCAGREDRSVGFAWAASAVSTTEIVMTKYDGTYPGGTNYEFSLICTYFT